MTKILVLQGANMNWLGKRQPEIYGRTTAAELDDKLRAYAREHDIAIEIFYTNTEGEAIDRIYRAADEGTAAVVMNPGGLCYAGYALRDCIKGVELPVVEVHVSNHYARGIESVSAAAAAVVLMGAGIKTYMLGLDAAVHLAKERERAAAAAH